MEPLFVKLLLRYCQFTFSTNNWTVGDAIRYGQYNYLLLRPLSPVFDAVASEVAVKVVFMTFAVPLAALLALILRPDLEITAAGVAAFVPALVMAWALRWLWGFWLAILAFWATRADALLSLQESLVFLFGGQIAPPALLPGFMQTLADILPFRYMVAFPVEVLTGQLSPAEVGAGFTWQAGWLLSTAALFALLWRAGLRRYTAVGG